MNGGEIAEKKFIATLGCLRGQRLQLLPAQSPPITIKTLETPYRQSLRPLGVFPASTTPQVIEQLTESQLVAFCKNHSIGKAGPFSKSDVFINGVGYSLKYTNSSPPALINHTRRTGWEFAAQHTGASIAQLDSLISDYWRLRLTGIISEDTANSDPNSPFSKHFNTLLPFLEFFAFDGTATKLSYHPANEVIEFSDPCDITTWRLLNKAQLIASLWPRLVFSIRSKKGMPSARMFSSMSAQEKASVMRWSHQVNGELKGALHVRIKH